MGYKRALDAFKGEKEKKTDKFGPKSAGSGMSKPFNPQAVCACPQLSGRLASLLGTLADMHNATHLLPTEQEPVHLSGQHAHQEDVDAMCGVHLQVSQRAARPI